MRIKTENDVHVLGLLRPLHDLHNLTVFDVAKTPIVHWWVHDRVIYPVTQSGVVHSVEVPVLLPGGAVRHFGNNLNGEVVPVVYPTVAHWVQSLRDAHGQGSVSMR